MEDFFLAVLWRRRCYKKHLCSGFLQLIHHQFLIGVPAGNPVWIIRQNPFPYFALSILPKLIQLRPRKHIAAPTLINVFFDDSITFLFRKFPHGGKLGFDGMLLLLPRRRDTRINGDQLYLFFNVFHHRFNFYVFPKTF